MPVRTVMQAGGWSSVNALDPYLNSPTPEQIVTDFKAAGWD